MNVSALATALPGAVTPSNLTYNLIAHPTFVRCVVM